MTTHHRRHCRHSDFTFSDGFMTGAMTTFVVLVGAVFLSPTPEPRAPERFSVAHVERLPAPDADRLDRWHVERALASPECLERYLAGGL